MSETKVGYSSVPKHKLREIIKMYRSQWIMAMKDLRGGYSTRNGTMMCPFCGMAEGIWRRVYEAPKEHGLLPEDTPLSKCYLCVWAYFTGEGCCDGFTEWYWENADYAAGIGLVSARNNPKLLPMWADKRVKDLNVWIKRVKAWV